MNVVKDIIVRHRWSMDSESSMESGDIAINRNIVCFLKNNSPPLGCGRIIGSLNGVSINIIVDDFYMANKGVKQ